MPGPLLSRGLWRLLDSEGLGLPTEASSLHPADCRASVLLRPVLPVLILEGPEAVL